MNCRQLRTDSINYIKTDYENTCAKATDEEYCSWDPRGFSQYPLRRESKELSLKRQLQSLAASIISPAAQML